MNFTDDKIKEICERRNISSFWEAVEYMLIASYTEIEALIIASGLFYGDIWGRVINVAKINKNNGVGYFSSGSTYTIDYEIETSRPVYIFSSDLAIISDPDDLTVDVFILNHKANPAHMPVYKAYIETRQYKLIPELEEQITKLTLVLTTEVGIKLFNDGFAKFK